MSISQNSPRRSPALAAPSKPSSTHLSLSINLVARLCFSPLRALCSRPTPDNLYRNFIRHCLIPSNVMDSFREEKVQRFEEFIDTRLKPDLVRAISERDKVFEQQKVFSDLRRNIENLEKNSVTSFRSLVNIGSEVYVQAEVPDTQRIFVDVGLGFHVEFTWAEALNYISLREEKLARQIEEFTHLISSIKAQIKLVCEGIRELLQLPS